MPQATQIAPQWLQPHVMTVVNDNTKFEDTITTVDNNVKFLAVFRSDMGPDNVLVKKTELADFKKTYGDSDYVKYGQPLLMPIAELTNGNASVYCMRIMPSDATYANTIINLMYKADSVSHKMVFKFGASVVSSATSDATIQAAFDATPTPIPDEDGYVSIPIMYIRPVGRGKYGNNLRFRITRDSNYERDYKIKMYDFEVLSVSSGITKIATYVGSLVTSSKYNKTTFISDLLDDKDVDEKYFDIKVNESAISTVYDAFVDFIGTVPEENRGEIPDLDEFDPLFGLLVNSTSVHENMDFDTAAGDDNYYAIDNIEGNVLANGSDGSFDSDVPETRENAINLSYVAAFNGSLDKAILAPRRTPIDIILDANYSREANDGQTSVKMALYQLANARDDCPVVFDAGFINNSAEISSAIFDLESINTRNATKEFQHYKIRDPRTNKRVDVTTTYMWACNFAAHCKTYGNHIPFVKNYATITGHVKNSLLPSIELALTDMELKETLYNARFNYYETIAENTFARAVQNTAQIDNSDLMEENNMRVLFDIKKILEDDCQENLYNFANATERSAFTEYEKAKFSPWVGSRIASFNISFEMTPWEAERSILHCYAAVQFRTLNKRTIIEIDVNKRDFTS